MSKSAQPELVKVFTYRRVSTQTQARKGYGLDEQAHQLQAFCEAQGFEVVGQFEDRGISGADVDEEDLVVIRPGLERLLAALKDSPVQYVVVQNSNRLWRSDMAKILIQKQLRRYKVDVKAIDRPTYSIYNHGQDPSAYMVNAMLEILDAYERLEIRLKLLRGRNRKAARGGFAGGRAAFGYTDQSGGKVLEVNEEQAATVRRIFALQAEHPDWTYQAIADQLNSEGHQTARGRAFRRQQVHAILSKREFYSGIYKYGSITTEGQHRPLI